MKNPFNKGIVYTFYSYKGGVGRSMAVANVAALLTKLGNKVLIIDWDLEAPGLHRFFQKDYLELHGDPIYKEGIVDLLIAKTEDRFFNWKENLLKVNLSDNELHILSAGKQDDNYQKRLQSLNWNNLFNKYGISDYLNELREELILEYDYVLIDSRTGVTDIGDICTVLLPDRIILLFVSNHQNIDGIHKIMRRAKKAHRKLPIERSNLIGIPVPSRDEIYTEYQQSKKWKDIYANKFREYYEEWLPRYVKPKDALNRIFIPYFSNWSFGECLPVLENEEELENPSTIGAAYLRLTHLITSNLDWFETTSSTNPEEVKTAQIEASNAKYIIEKHELESIKDQKIIMRFRYMTYLLSLLIVATFIAYLLPRFFSQNSTLTEKNAYSLISDKSVSSSRQVEAFEFLSQKKLPISSIEMDNAVILSASLDELFVTSSSFKDVTFNNTSLRNSSILKSDLRYASFDNVDLTGAILDESCILGADFRRAKGLEIAQFEYAIGWEKARFKESFEDSLFKYFYYDTDNYYSSKFDSTFYERNLPFTECD